MSKYNIPDYHLHTLFSGDCETPLEDIISSALDKGLTSMCITDHNDLELPGNPHDDDGNPISFDLDIDSYIPRLLSLKQEVLEELPDKMEITMRAQMTPEQQRIYRAALERLRPRIPAPALSFSEHPDVSGRPCQRGGLSRHPFRADNRS